MNAAFTKNGKEFYYCTKYKNTWAIFYTKEINGYWIKPKPMHFTSPDFADRDLTISPDGNRIYFGSNRPKKRGKKPLKSLDIYYIKRIYSTTWSYPINAGEIINSDYLDNYPAISRNRNLYFFSCRPDGIGLCDIYMSEFVKGRYKKPICLDNAINSEKNDWDAYISPDESYIIFSSQNRSDTIGDQDLYISFKKSDQTWTKALNMGKRVNSESSEICPGVSLDGKYLFFTSKKRGKADIYWVDAKIIEEFKPKNLK